MRLHQLRVENIPKHKVSVLDFGSDNNYREDILQAILFHGHRCKNNLEGRACIDWQQEDPDKILNDRVLEKPFRLNMMTQRDMV